MGGNTALDDGNDVALDPGGNIVVVGRTECPDFPTAGALDPILGRFSDAFISKFSPAGALLWSTFLGGGDEDFATSAAVDASGNVVVVGETRSVTFPLVGAFDSFYPGDFTPGCTKQMCQYRDQFAEFQGVEAVLLGISPQDVDRHREWIAAKQFPFPLLADTDRKVIAAYGVKGFGPIPVKRSTFVIDAEGVVRHKRVASIGLSWDKPGELAQIVAGV